MLLRCTRGVLLLFSRNLGLSVSCSWELTQHERYKRGWWYLRKVTWLRKIIWHVFCFCHWFYKHQCESFCSWKCGKSTDHFLLTMRHHLLTMCCSYSTVSARLVLVLMVKQCFFSVWSCVFCTERSPVPSGLIHHGPSPLLCPIRIRAAISVLYLWRDAPCIVFMPPRPNSIK